MVKLTNEQALALPKSHPARFLHFYGTSAPFVNPVGWDAKTYDDVGGAIRAATYYLFIFNHPFGADIAACAETNS